MALMPGSLEYEYDTGRVAGVKVLSSRPPSLSRTVWHGCRGLLVLA